MESSRQKYTVAGFLVFGCISFSLHYFYHRVGPDFFLLSGYSDSPQQVNLWTRGIATAGINEPNSICTFDMEETDPKSPILGKDLRSKCYEGLDFRPAIDLEAETVDLSKVIRLNAGASGWRDACMWHAMTVFL